MRPILLYASIVSLTSILFGCGNADVFNKRKYLNLNDRSSKNVHPAISIVSKNPDVDFPDRFLRSESPPCDTIALNNGEILIAKILEETYDSLIYRYCCPENNSAAGDPKIADCDSTVRHSKSWSDIDFLYSEKEKVEEQQLTLTEAESERMINTGFLWIVLGLVIALVASGITLFYWFLINSVSSWWSKEGIGIFIGFTIVMNLAVLITSLWLIFSGAGKIKKGKNAIIKN